MHVVFSPYKKMSLNKTHNNKIVCFEDSCRRLPTLGLCIAICRNLLISAEVLNVHSCFK